MSRNTQAVHSEMRRVHPVPRQETSKLSEIEDSLVDIGYGHDVLEEIRERVTALLDASLDRQLDEILDDVISALDEATGRAADIIEGESQDDV